MTFDDPSRRTEMAMGEYAPQVEERARRILAAVDLSGLGLEIGASYNPLLPKRSGARIEIVDHATREELVTKYRALGIPDEQVNQIEEVDYVSGGGSFVEAIGRTSAYDFIIGSNVIEHMVDLIAFLQDVDALLKPGGRLSLSVPDLRFCFDLLRPVTSISDVIDAHHYPTRFHTAGTLLEYTTYSCMRDEDIAWLPEDERPVRFRWPEADSRKLIQQGLDQAEYHDAHRWTFTPSSFALLIQDLRELGYHSLVQIDSEPPIGFEFFVTLGHSDKPAPARDRLELLQQVRSELALVAERDGLGPKAVQLARDLETARREAEAASRDLEAARRDLETAGREADSLRVLVAQREEELAAARDETEHLRHLELLREEALANLHRDLDAVLASRSWQMTRPVRFLSSVLRRR